MLKLKYVNESLCKCGDKVLDVPLGSEYMIDPNRVTSAIMQCPTCKKWSAQVMFWAISVDGQDGFLVANAFDFDPDILGRDTMIEMPKGRPEEREEVEAQARELMERLFARIDSEINPNPTEGH